MAPSRLLVASLLKVLLFSDLVSSAPTPDNVARDANKSTTSSLGLWEKTLTFDLVPVAVSLLSNGKLLMWSSYARDAWGGNRGYTQTAIYDPATGVSTPMTVSNTDHDMFCPGISMDFNGRVVVTGGDSALRTSIYDPAGNDWISGPNMNIGRGYQSSATCSDGRIFTIGGSWSGGHVVKNGEIYDPVANTWTWVTDALVGPMMTHDAGGEWRQDNHAWLFGWKDQTVFQAGPSEAMNWYDTVGSGSTTGAGSRLDDGDSMVGNAVMYDAVQGKILTAGGAPSYENSTAKSNAYVITLGGPKTNPTVTKTQSMQHARGFANGVVLPDGTVFVTGGQSYLKPFTDTTPVLVPELWSPVTGTWTQLTAMTIPRTYHSVAILLPDATVFNGGGGLCGECVAYGGTGNNHYTASIFTPPYLLNADGTARSRPVINTVASTVQLGGSLTIMTRNSVTSFSLIRFGTATHTVNTDQRRIPLTPSSSSGTSYTVTIPSDPGVALPGYWMLFAIDSLGTPSVASTVKVTA